MQMNLTGITVLIVVLAIIVGTCLVGCPKYNVYQQEMEGKAELQRAISNRQIAIQEAHAKMEAAKDLAEAEIIRAGGIAKANEIIGNSLKDNEAYLHWLWIDQLENNKNSVIYVPTEANLPILESNRFKFPATDPARK